MAGDEIKKFFPDNFGRAWIELLESDLSEHARMCYVAMTSFGRESRAGKAAIAKRMGVKSLTTVKAAQKELIGAGWIHCATQGGLDGKTPNVWHVYGTAGAYSAPPQGAESPPPGRITPPKQEDKHEDKQEKDTADAVRKAKFAAIGAILTTFKKLWEVKYKEPYDEKINPQDGRAAEAMWKLGITPEQVSVKAPQFLASAETWLVEKRHPFWQLKYKWNDYSIKPKKEDDFSRQGL